MPLYKPPTVVTTCQQPYGALVAQADPSWSRDKFWEIEYEVTGRIFENNPYGTTGPYSRRSNTYAVGQAYGGLDPLIEAALAPTVGNPVPGLYSGVPDNKGWA
jgi:hypothetical protein